MKKALSEQQEKCLFYIQQGMTAREIALAMDLSRRTVEYYIQIIKQKTGVEKKNQLIGLTAKG